MRQFRRSGRRQVTCAPRVEALEARKLLSVIYSADMSTNPGWTLDTGWQYGIPAGTGGDPSAGHTGRNVLGTVISSPGTYPPNVPSTYYATTGPIDCSNYTGVTLSFWRYLGVLSGDTARIGVSSNGNTWTNVWTSSGTISDGGWVSPPAYDLSAVADLHSTVYIRWGLGPTDASGQSYGWNIDDVTVAGTLHPAPIVTGIACVGASPTNAASLDYAVTFSAPVTGVDRSDFRLSTTGTASGLIASVSGSGSSYTVTVSPVAGEGTLGLNLFDDDTIQDSLGVPLGGTGAGNGNFIGQSYTIDRIVPTVSGIAISTRTRDSISYNVYFSEAVGGVDLSDFTPVFTGTAAGSISTVTGSGSTYQVVVATGSGDGTVALKLVDNDTITDAAGNALGGSGAGNGDYISGAISVDHTAPWVVATTPSTGGLLVSSSQNIDVTFSEQAYLVDATDLVLGGPAALSASVGTPVDLGSSTWRFPVTGLVSGKLAVTLAPDAGNIQDWTGNVLAKVAWGYRVNLATDIVCRYWPSEATSPDLYRMRADGTGLAMVGTGTAGLAGQPAISSDGTKIAYAADNKIWSMDADGTNQHVVTSGASIWANPAFSPDGSKIAAEDDTGHVWELNADGSGGTMVNIPGVTSIRKPSYSSDSTLAVSGWNGSSWDLYLVSPDRTSQIRLTTDPANEEAPSLSRDGKKVAFQWNRDGNYEIYVIDVDGTHLRRLTASPGFDGDPCFSPDGTQIVFVSNRDGGNEIYTMNSDGSNIAPITGPVGTVGAIDPAWGVHGMTPRALSILTLDPAHTNAASVRWTLTFNETVNGVDPTDFVLAKTGTANAALTISGSGAVYTVTASSVTGDGTLTLNLVDDDSIQDIGANPLGGEGAGNGDLTGQTFVIDHTVPTAFAAANFGEAQRSMVAHLYVQFSEAVPLTPPALLLLTRAGAAVPNVGLAIRDTVGNKLTYDITFTGTGLDNGSLRDGTYRLVIVASSSRDLAGNPMAANYNLRFHRLFGDSNGDRIVDRAELVAFRRALNVPANYAGCFDYNNDGLITLTDYRELRKRLLRRGVL